jgi:hypothetical protein
VAGRIDTTIPSMRPNAFEPGQNPAVHLPRLRLQPFLEDEDAIAYSGEPG